jgi:hypothetical protein
VVCASQATWPVAHRSATDAKIDRCRKAQHEHGIHVSPTTAVASDYPPNADRFSCVSASDFCESEVDRPRPARAGRGYLMVNSSSGRAASCTPNRMRIKQRSPYATPIRRKKIVTNGIKRSSPDFIKLVYLVSDREKIIVAMAFLEDSLTRMIRARLACACGEPKVVNEVISTDGGGILHGAQAKIKVARALGMIDGKIEAAIVAMQSMRNKSAHRIEPQEIAGGMTESQVESIASNLDNAIYDMFDILSEEEPIDPSCKFCVCANNLNATLRRIAESEERRLGKKQSHKIAPKKPKSPRVRRIRHHD